MSDVNYCMVKYHKVNVEAETMGLADGNVMGAVITYQYEGLLCVYI